MTTAQVRQLSCIESTLEILAPQIIDDPNVMENIEIIRHDIKSRVKYNSITQALCDAIDVDLERDAKFDLSAQALEGSDSSSTSATLDKCKEIFKF